MQKLPSLYQKLFEAMLSDHGSYAVARLVREGADLSVCHPDTGQTALYTATRANHFLAVKALLKYGANPNQRMTYRSPIDGRVDDGRVALHYALSSGIAEALVDAGAEVDATDAMGTTPLMCAAFEGHVSVLKSLLASGASPLARQFEPRGRQGHNARDRVEAKLEMIRKIIREKKLIFAELRLGSYEEIRAALIEAEIKINARS
jgi:ankyrin repeat protein